MKRSSKLYFRKCSHILLTTYLIIMYIIYLSSFTTKISAHYCQSCHPTHPDALNVHIVCHTHLDTGWTNTYDEYYIYYVKQIYSSVLESLLKDGNRRFIAVEASYFTRWFMEQNSRIQQTVRQLVSSGRLEFIGGGWSMNDEAAAHYSSIIDNMSYGHKKLDQNFGICGRPKTGWQIDPFGHSREQASLLAQMGFDSLFLGRIDYQDKEQRERTRTLEFIWKSSPSIGEKCDIFTSVLPNVYWPPKGFCYDRNCFDETLNPQNILRKTREFIEFVKKQASFYGTKHTIITMGMDFYYRDAEKWYSNLDYLMQSVNSLTDKGGGVHMIYSTPSCYAKALHGENRTWPIKLDDFFPYADAPNAYWTGYFTSRPSLKYAIKRGANLMHVANQLNVMALKGYEHAKGFEELKSVMGILQHHDAVTGTSKQYVNDNYLEMYTRAKHKAHDAIVSAYITLTRAETAPGQSVIGFCDESHLSKCLYTELIHGNISTVMSIYNPIAHPLRHFVRLPVRKDTLYTVVDHNENIIPSQLVVIHPKLTSLSERINSYATHELVFLSTLDPLGISSYLITSAKSNDYGVSNEAQNGYIGQDVLLHNGKLGIVIDGLSGLIKEIQLPSGENIPFTQAFWYYKGTPGYSGEKPSGAYAFNPTTSSPFILSANASFKIYRGALVDEVHQVFTDWCTQVIKLYKNYNYIEFDWVIGPIPKKFPESTGLEIITRYETNFQNKQTFFTDSNGRETIRRIRDYRPTWELKTSEKVASNYYPVISWIFIRDITKDLQMTILPDRPQGGSSMVDGTIELMLHRRLLYDDGYGMEEALDEPGFDSLGLVARGKHRLIIDRIQESVRFMRKLSKTTSWIPIYMFRNVPTMYGPNLVSNLYTVGLREKLPVNIHLLSLEQWDEDNILIRLEHFYEINEDIKYSRETQVKLANLFTNFIIEDVREMNLAGIDGLQQSEQSKLRFQAELDPYENYTMVLSSHFTRDSTISSDGSFMIYMKPMEIRTFLVRVRPRLYI